MADRDPDIRASDLDRERTIAILREHMVEGRLDTAGLSARVGRAYEALTLGELARVLDHLPPIASPIGQPQTRRQRALLRRHERALTRWERIRAAKKSQLELAKGGNAGHHSEFPCQAGERILARVPRTALRVWTTTPGHTERRTTTRYQRNVFGGGRRVGTTRTYKVPGRDVQVTADVGVLYLTNQRIGFRGPKRTLEVPIRNSGGVNVNTASRKIVVSLAGGRPVTFRYPIDPLGHTAFAAQLALAHSNGTVSSLVAGLQAEIEELDRSQPKLSPEALGPLSEKAARRTRPERRDSARPLKTYALGARRILSGQLSDRRAQPSRLIGFATLLVVILLVFGITKIYHVIARSSYGDGYSWGSAETVGVISKTAPSCSLSEMRSNGPNDDPNFIFNKPQGANEPNDNYPQWRSGCEAGAQNTIDSFGSSTPTTTTTTNPPPPSLSSQQSLCETHGGPDSVVYDEPNNDYYLFCADYTMFEVAPGTGTPVTTISP